MTNLARVRVDLEGWTGGPGVNTLYFSQGSLLAWDTSTVDALRADVYTCWALMRGLIISTLTATVRPDVDIIDVVNGEIQNVITGPTSYVTTGDATTNVESRATQVNVAFKTDQFFDGRRLQGRVFVGPAGSGTLDTNGQVTSGAIATINGAFADLIDASGAKLAVYSRPVEASTGPPVVTGHDGRYGDVVAVLPRSIPGTLRSRKN